MQKQHSTDYSSFSKDDLINLIETKSNMVSIYETEMQNSQTRINALIKEKKDLTQLNIVLTNGFSTLEAFAAWVLGQETLKSVRDADNNYDLDVMRAKYEILHNDVQTLKENNENLIAKLEQSALNEEKF